MLCKSVSLSRTATAVVSLVVCMVVCGCGKGTPEEQAMKVAADSYSSLMEGDYEDFLDGYAGMDSIPDSFREQLLVSYKQFMHQQKEVHQGLAGITATRALMDSSLNVMQVFLMVSYADSTQEEIVVPMVEHNGEWKMK